MIIFAKGYALEHDDQQLALAQDEHLPDEAWSEELWPE